KDVRHVGTETVDGIRTERYHAILDPRKAQSRLHGRSRCGFEAVARSLGQRSIAADVWIDRQGRVRQIKMSFNLPGASGVAVTFMIKLFDFGAPVSISTPPSSQVYDAARPQVSGTVPRCGGT